MIKKIKYIFTLGFFVILVILTTNYYFSEQNVNETNKSRTFYLLNQDNNLKNLPLLKNDTENIIEYRDDIETYKKNKKNYTFWCLIGKCIEKQ